MGEKQIKRLIWIVSVVVFGAVVALNRKVIPVAIETPQFVYSLPGLNAILNGTCSVLLILSFLFIKRKRIDWHKRMNLSALVLSSLFLISYVTAHYFLPETRFGDVDHNDVLSEDERSAAGSLRIIYLILLSSHILLAAAILPFVLLSFYYGLNNKLDQHKKLVRFTFPVWLYVTITGVLVYLMIKPYYPF